MPQHLLIIGFNFPEPQSSAAGSRMMQLIQLFQDKSWEITFASPAQNTEFSVDLEEYGIAVKSIKPNNEKAGSLLKNINPDVVLFDRFMIEEQFGWRVAEVCPDALRILDTEDLHFLRRARHNAVKDGKKISEADLYTETAKREIASILRCDFSLIISQVEHKILREKFKIHEGQLLYLPFLTENLNEKDLVRLPVYEKRQDFMFIGNYLHAPNYDAVLYLKTKIWPLIHEILPQSEMHIYGAYAQQKVKQLENKRQKFIVRGRATDLQTVFQNHKILLAPLRFGAGLKGKFIDAMQNGTPSITTPIGAEGISGALPFNGFITENPKDIAQAAVKLYQNEQEWETAQTNGMHLINSRFDKHTFSKLFMEKLIDWQKNIKTYRQQYFLGALLMHHRQQSTKYMARWIEAKNKIKD